MSTSLFLGFVALMAVVIVALSFRYLARPAAFTFAAGLSLWLVYVGVMGYRGVIGNTAMRPPGAAFLFVPIVLALALFIVRMRSSAGKEWALAFPLWILLGLQSFRIIVELILHQLWIDGLVPRMLTFEGANVDIYVGATAPVIAWLSVRGRAGMKIALIWNFLGLLVLANVVVRAVLTAPGPLNLIHAEVPNRMIGTFPFMFIPGLFVPLAVVLHVMAIRSISCRMNRGRS
jgi:hypothetical protein